MHGWRIATLRGVPIFIGRSWLVVALFIVLLMGPRLAAAGAGLAVGGYFVAAGYALLLLGSVLVHEAAHALVGQQQGFRVQRIVADLWGGHTAYDHGENSARSSALVAVVGPLANGALALLGWLALQVANPGGVPELLLAAFTWSNGFVAVFNLLPGLPLDGGFLMEALIWQLTGRRTTGTVAAGWCGRVTAVLIVAWAVAMPFIFGLQPSLVTLAGAVFIATFMWVGATSAIKSGRGRAVIAGVRIREVMVPVTVAPDEMPVAHLPMGPVVVQHPGRGVWGLVDPGAVSAVPISARVTLPARAVAAAQPPGWVVDIDDLDGDVLPVVAAIQERGLAHVLVRGRQPDRDVGLVRTQDLGAALKRSAGKGR